MTNRTQHLVDEIGRLLIERKQTLATAESVTSGKLQYAFALAENTMDFFEGGITTYNKTQKVNLLKVDEKEAEDTNCVSENIASSMAMGTAKIFESAWGIGITGYASPVPELKIEELFACYAISFNGKIVQRGVIHAPSRLPEQVIEYYCQRILEELVEGVKKEKEKQKQKQ